MPGVNREELNADGQATTAHQELDSSDSLEQAPMIDRA
jgi:hypothetical protein